MTHLQIVIQTPSLLPPGMGNQDVPLPMLSLEPLFGTSIREDAKGRAMLVRDGSGPMPTTRTTYTYEPVENVLARFFGDGQGECSQADRDAAQGEYDKDVVAKGGLKP